MAQQISIEAAYAAMLRKCMQLLESTVLLEARVAELEEAAGVREASAPAYPMSSADGQG